MYTRRALCKKIAFLCGGLLAACVPTPPVPPVTPTPAPATPAGQPTPPRVDPQILLTGLDFPEGPAFDPQGRLWCTELLGGNLVRYENGRAYRYPIGGESGGRGNGLAFDHQGRAWVTDSGRNVIQRFDPNAEKWEVILASIDGAPLQSPNDLCFDAQGNLLFTCPNFASTEPTGYVVCLRPDGSARKIAEGFYRPNGLDLVEGGASLVVADTYRKTLFKGAWDASALVWQDPQPWAEVGGAEGPDGMAPGADGFLYQAIYGDGVIRVINPRGKVQREIRVPGANPTNVAIDPSGKLGIVVTETEKGQLISFPAEAPGSAIFDGGGAWK